MMRRLGLPTGEFGEMPGGVVRIGDEMRCVKGLHCKALTVPPPPLLGCCHPIGREPQ